MAIGKFSCKYCGPAIVGHKADCPHWANKKSQKKRYAVWGIDKTYRFLWMAALAAGIKAAKDRYNQGVNIS